MSQLPLLGPAGCRPSTLWRMSWGRSRLHAVGTAVMSLTQQDVLGSVESCLKVLSPLRGVQCFLSLRLCPIHALALEGLTLDGPPFGLSKLPTAVMGRVWFCCQHPLLRLNGLHAWVSSIFEPLPTDVSGAWCGAEVMATLNYLIKPSHLQCVLGVGLWSEGVPMRCLPVPQGADRLPWDATASPWF